VPRGLKLTYKREKGIEKNLREKVKAAGGLAPKFTSPGLPGVPDRLIFLPVPPEHQTIVAKYFKMVECKAPDGVVAAHQSRLHEKFRKLGYEVIVLNSKDLGEIL